MRDLLVYLDASAPMRNACRLAADWAARTAARLGVLLVDRFTPWPSAFGTELSPALIEAQRAAFAAERDRLHAEVTAALEAAGVAWRWWDEQGDPVAALARHSAAVDAVVVGHPWVEGELGEFRLLDAAVLGTGRPVLAVPAGYEGTLDAARVLVAWDGGREAARAVHDALPLLEAAEEVLVVTVGAPPGPRTPAEALVDHLARHAVRARAVRLDGEPAAAVLECARRERCGLIVMGAWGHSRLREWVLGGCTRGVLEAADRPVWLSH